MGRKSAEQTNMSAKSALKSAKKHYRKMCFNKFQRKFAHHHQGGRHHHQGGHLHHQRGRHHHQGGRHHHKEGRHHHQ